MRRENRAAEDIEDVENDLNNHNVRTLTNPYEGPSTSRAAKTKKSTTEAPTKAKNAVRGAARRKMSSQQRMLKLLQEITKLQESTARQIPRLPFARLVREISLNFNPDITRYTLTAMEALHEASEMYITQVLQDSYLLSMHRNRVTLTKADIILARALKFDI